MVHVILFTYLFVSFCGFRFACKCNCFLHVSITLYFTGNRWTFNIVSWIFYFWNNVTNFFLNLPTQLARDVLGPSHEDPLKVLTSGTSWEPSGDSWRTNTKIDDLMKKVFFRCNSPCFTHLLQFFLLEKQIFKKSKWGHSQDVYGTQLRDVPETKLWDALGTSAGRRSYIFFKSNSET